jgi:hypothetical protein
MSELVHHTWQGPNYTGNQSAAEALAQKIVDFWRQRGGDIDIRIETSAAQNKSAPVFAIRSDLRNGLPPGFRQPSSIQEEPAVQ